jgi:hypothetical protein
MAEADDSTLDRVAAVLGPRIAEHIAPMAPAVDGWLPIADAAAHLWITRNALHKLTAARAIPFEQDGPEPNAGFKRSELDAWRRGRQPCHDYRAAP